MSREAPRFAEQGQLPRLRSGKVLLWRPREILIFLPVHEDRQRTSHPPAD